MTYSKKADEKNYAGKTKLTIPLENMVLPNGDITQKIGPIGAMYYLCSVRFQIFYVEVAKWVTKLNI